VPTLIKDLSNKQPDDLKLLEKQDENKLKTSKWREIIRSEARSMRLEQKKNYTKNQ
jgi:hypothetical protein